MISLGKMHWAIRDALQRMKPGETMFIARHDQEPEHYTKITRNADTLDMTEIQKPDDAPS